MEQKLFCIGIAMALYAWLTKRFLKKNTLSSSLHVATWHGLFCASVVFIIVLVISVSLDNKKPTIPAASVSIKQIAIWSVIVLIGGIYGFFKARKKKADGMKKIMKEDLEWSETIFSAVLLAAFVMYFFVQAFKIPSASMRNTFIEGDHLFVNKFTYGFRIPFTEKRILKFNKVNSKDVIVFRFPSDNPAELHCGSVQYGRDFIKRVIGLPGDKIEVRSGQVLVNDKPVKDEYYAQYSDGRRIPMAMVHDSLEQYQKTWENRNLGRRYGERVRDYFGPVIVPQNSYFVMGDNRDHSCDSRFWGPVSEKELKGKAWFIYWPPSRIHGIN